MPFVAEPLGAVAGVEFPEGSVPGGAVPVAGVRAGLDQPTLHDLTEKTRLEQSLPVNTTQFLGLKYAPTTLLEITEKGQGGAEFFVGRRHCNLFRSINNRRQR
jgi:hypothetical protein